MFDPAAPTADYALTWPRAVFHAEATALASRSGDPAQWSRDAAWLLEDAFAGEIPARDLTTATSTRVLALTQRVLPIPTAPPGTSRAVVLAAAVASMGGAGALAGDPQLQYLKYLIRVTDQLPEHHEPAYWSARRNRAEDLEFVRVQTRWTALVGDLQRKGYLARAAPPTCVRAKISEPPPAYQRQTRPGGPAARSPRQPRHSRHHPPDRDRPVRLRLRLRGQHH